MLGLHSQVSLALVLGINAMPASANEDVNRIERGLRPAVALAGKPVPTRTLAEEMARLRVPGVSVAVIRNGAIAWAKGYGVTHAGGPAVTADTLFQAASISKPVSAVAALHMVQARQLDLDADINQALVGWKLPPGPGGSHATLRQLLSHTAGTTVSGFGGYAAGQAVPTLKQLLDGAAPANSAAVRIDTLPASTWRYSGGGYSVVQQAIVDRSGRAFGKQLADTVLTPLGMTRSTFLQPLAAPLKANAAQPHDAQGKPYAGGAYTYPELAAAGMWTTASDLARFAIGVQRSAAGHPGAILTASTARTLLTPVKNGYALGFEMQGKNAALAFAHGGSNKGYQNTLHAFVKQGDGAVIMTNGDGGDELAHSVLRAIAAEYNWRGKQTAVRQAIHLTAARRSELAGRYAIKDLGSFDILEQGGQLMFSIREGVVEPLFAASPTVLFVLSRELELRLPGAGAAGGQLVSGPFDVKFTREKSTAANADKP